ncbi:MAG: GTP-binding protein [Planctomycetota bacterium]|jgi:GTP-binding protein
MALIDEVTLTTKAGKGGDGVVRWRREKSRPLSGPGGGNGGRGGDVYALAVSDLAYMEYYRHSKDFDAPAGEAGGNMGCEGANGEPLILRFPVGSLIINRETGETIELNQVGQQELLLRGGRGGLGNEHFKSSRNTTPYESTPGTYGETATFDIELQLFADIGLIGLPSAGKSTLLNALTNAKSKVAAYHFTTLEPYLGAMPGGMILADIPGLIEGASEGKGLGHQFLRHIQRTKVLAHIISTENPDVAVAYNVIREEMGKYNPELLKKKELVILSKIDEVSEEEAQKMQKELAETSGVEVLLSSAYNDDSLTVIRKAFIDVE